MPYRKIKAINKDNMTESTENLTNEEEAPINSENAENNAEVNTVSEEETLDPQVQIDALNDKYLRLYAEFDNYKRRTAKERIELFKTANADVIK
jgi:molecular chaperone GrpE